MDATLLIPAAVVLGGLVCALALALVLWRRVGRIGGEVQRLGSLPPPAVSAPDPVPDPVPDLVPAPAMVPTPEPAAPPPPAIEEARVAALESETREHAANLASLGAWAADVKGQVAALEAAVKALDEAARDVPSEQPEPTDRAERAIVAHLTREGCEDIRLLGCLPAAEGQSGDRIWRFEARRGGVVVKGGAQVDAQGHVSVRMTPSTRAFP